MNIAVNTRMLLKNRMEGIARYSFETTKRLVINNPQHQFYFFFDRPYDASFLFAKNVIPIVLFPQARHPILWYYWFEVSVKRALQKYKIDVFYSPDNYLSLSAKTPTVMVTHDLAYVHYPNYLPKLTSKYCNYYMPKFNQRANHIIAVSEATKTDIAKTFNIKEDKITVAHNSCPEGFSKATPEHKLAMQVKYAQGRPYIIYVGSVHPRKNVHTIIKAFSQFKKTNPNSKLQLVLAGRWAWMSEDTRKTLDQSLYKNEIHVNYNPADGIPAILSGAEFSLYISVYEGFGIPVLEAMQSEIPVITSNISSMPEVAGDAAVLVDPHNVSEVATAIQSLTSKKELRERLIQKGKERVQHFSWDTTAETIYTSLLGVL